MTMLLRRLAALALIVALIVATPVLAAVPATASDAAALTMRTRKADYEDVKLELTNAIISRGLVVDANGQVARMLERTGADVGSTRPIYRQAEYFAFCSARLSRQMMEADPRDIGLCPFVVFMYETVAEPGLVHVGYRSLPAAGTPASAAALSQIKALLDAIIAEAVQ